MVGAFDAPRSSKAACPGKRVRAAVIAQQRDGESDDDADDSRADDDLSEWRGIAEAVYLRNNREYLDWWLMQKFPGRTLEELDRIDWLRLQRALEVGRIVELEAKNTLVTEGKLPAESLTAREWAQIQRHNALFDEWEAAHG